MQHIILSIVCIAFVLLVRGQIANTENDLSLDLLKNEIDELRRHMVIVDSRVWDLENENDNMKSQVKELKNENDEFVYNLILILHQLIS